jgi:hypothetical protein
MRKLIFVTTLAAGCFLGLLQTAQAAVVTEDIGNLGDAVPMASYGYNPVTAPDFRLDGSGQGTFRVNFQFVDPAIKTATSITASATGGVALKDFTFGLYNSANQLLSEVDQTTAHYANGSTTASFLSFATMLQTGSYYLLLAVTQGNAQQVINGNIAIEPAPIPASLPMFAAALAGLMIIQMRRRQHSHT